MVISPFGQRSPTGAGGQPGGCSQAGSVYFAKSGLDFLLSSPFSSFKALLALSWSLLKLSASMSEAPLNFERGQLFFSLAWILQCCHKWADVWRLRKGFALCWLWFHVPEGLLLLPVVCSPPWADLGSRVGSELLDSQGFLMGEHLGLASHGHRQALGLAGAHSWH